MTAEEFIARLSESAFVILAIVTVGRALKTPRRVKIHTATFFVLIAVIVLISWLYQIIPGDPPRPLELLVVSLLVALPYPLLWLAADFVGIPRLVLRASELGLALSIMGLLLLGEGLPAWFTLFVVAYFVGTVVYASARFVVAALNMRSVSRLRMSLAAAASLSLALVILIAGIEAFVDSPVLRAGASAATLATGVGYYVGFALPTWLKRAVHANHLRKFLSVTVASSPGLLRQDEGFEEIESAVADALGTPNARIALWDEALDRLVAPTMGGPYPGVANPHSTIPWRAFQEQRSMFSEDAGKEDPENAAVYGGMVLLTAPITMGERRYGVLSAFGGLPPFLHDDDLQLLEVMADQIAVILRDRELLADVSTVRAREESVRLMDEFFAAVAHDLKTPLTTILGQGQRLQRQIRRGQPIDPAALDSTVAQAIHMRRLVADLLDDARERGRYIGERITTDMLDFVREVVDGTSYPDHPISVDGVHGEAPVDRERLRQVILNLLENAVKYSPGGGPIHVTVAATAAQVGFAVTDEGIGIPSSDLETIFERFSRGSREIDARFAGIGVGLYTCRAIVEEHGGTIRVESSPGVGSTFTVCLPTHLDTPTEQSSLALSAESQNPGEGSTNVQTGDGD